MRITVCDHCGDRKREAMRVELPTGKFSPDQAGGAKTQDIEYVDLCLQCAVKKLYTERANRVAGVAL